MGKFRDKIENFMRGRYGPDQLYTAMIAVSFALLIVNLFVRSAIFSTIVWLLLVLSLFRSFSRNIYKRQLENERFLKVWNRIKSSASLTVRRLKEIRTHRFRKCPHCKANLRLPRKTGKNTVQCPRCHNEFEQRILF